MLKCKNFPKIEPRNNSWNDCYTTTRHWPCTALTARTSIWNVSTRRFTITRVDIKSKFQQSSELDITSVLVFRNAKEEHDVFSFVMYWIFQFRALLIVTWNTGVLRFINQFFLFDTTSLCRNWFKRLIFHLPNHFSIPWKIFQWTPSCTRKPNKSSIVEKIFQIIMLTKSITCMIGWYITIFSTSNLLLKQSKNRFQHQSITDI